eukprot:jgi/Chrzof1/11258/Cz05g29210.t1
MATTLARSQVSAVSGTCRARSVRARLPATLRVGPRQRRHVCSTPRAYYGYGTCGPQDDATRKEYAKKMAEFWSKSMQGNPAFSGSFVWPGGSVSIGPDGVRYNNEASGAAAPNQARNLAIDIQETDAAYILYADIPGVAKSDLTIRLSTEGVLTVSGERKPLEDEGIKTRERRSGKFERKVPLAQDADADSVSARVTDGVLTITVQKKVQEPQSPDFRNIPVA